MAKNFINLTNGIEKIPTLDEYSFIRIQSTACEQKRWDFILQDLDNNFLMCAALNYECLIFDAGANKSVPRAVYQGIIWIKFVLNKYWLNKDTIPIVRGHNCYGYFNQAYNQLSNSTKKKLDYFKKFLCTDSINIHCITWPTRHDGKADFYKEVLIDNTYMRNKFNS